MLFVAVFLGCTSTGRVGLSNYGFVVLCPGTSEGSTSSCSGFKASQKMGQQLKVSSHRLGEKTTTFCGFSMGRNQYWAGRVYDLCVYYMTGTPEGSTESGFMEKPGIEPATPGLQGIALIHYTTGEAIPRPLH